MELINKFIELLPTLLLVLTSVVGSAATLFAAIQKVFNLSPNDTWDSRLNKIQQFLVMLLAILDRLALNPTDKVARKCTREDGKCDDSTGAAN